MNNERGGILSKMFVIPVGVALMVGFFFLGYYVGKYQSKSSSDVVVVPPLPDIAKDIPKQEEFTFYKTLADKDNKTVSIDLKPKAANEKSNVEQKQVTSDEPKKTAAPEPQKEIKIEMKDEKTVSPPVQKEPAAAKKQPVVAKKEPRTPSVPQSKVRYALQLASYQEREPAEDDVKKMKKQGYAAFVVTSQLPDKGTWYRVRLGSFSNKASAEKLQKELQAKAGVSPIIVTE
jgi:cell division septation protein DedD